MFVSILSAILLSGAHAQEAGPEQVLRYYERLTRDAARLDACREFSERDISGQPYFPVHYRVKECRFQTQLGRRCTISWLGGTRDERAPGIRCKDQQGEYAWSGRLPSRDTRDLRPLKDPRRPMPSANDSWWTF